MSRRREVTKREILPDPKHNDKLVAMFINKIMLKGKKSLAEKILYGAFDIIEKKTKESPLKIFKTALDNVKPIIEVKSRRVGGSTYQIPVEVSRKRRISLGLRWLVTFSRKRHEKSMKERMAEELIAASLGKSASFKKREDVHKMAEANKAFAHYRW